MNYYKELFDFYINRYSLEEYIFIGTSEYEVEAIEKTIKCQLPNAMREVLKYFGKDFYFGYEHENISSNGTIAIFFHDKNIDFVKSWEEKIKYPDHISDKEKEIVEFLMANDTLFVIDAIYETEQYYFIDLFKDNSPVYLQSISDPFPFCKSISDLAILGLQHRFISKYNSKMYKLRAVDRQDPNIKMTKEEILDLENEIDSLNQLIEVDNIQGALPRQFHNSSK